MIKISRRANLVLASMVLASTVMILVGLAIHGKVPGSPLAQVGCITFILELVAMWFTEAE